MAYGLFSNVGVLCRSALLIFALVMSAISAYPQPITCGNGRCDMHESRYTCQADCASGGYDNYCDSAADGLCDPDCVKTDIDCPDYEKNVRVVTASQDEDGTIIWKVVAVIAFFILVGAAVFVLYKKANRHTDMYSEEQIDKFSNVKKQDDKTWANQTEADILNNIKNSEDFRKYAR